MSTHRLRFYFIPFCIWLSASAAFAQQSPLPNPLVLSPNTIVGRGNQGTGAAYAMSFQEMASTMATLGISPLSAVTTSSVLGNFSGSNVQASQQSVPSCANDALHALTNDSGGGFNCAKVIPTATRAGDIVYWSGAAWVNLPGNNSGTQVLQENAAGVASWATFPGTGTVTSAAALVSRVALSRPPVPVRSL